MDVKHSFDPIIDKSSKVLILGTAPGEESLKAGQYYAHPRNQFWDILYNVFDRSKENDYQDRISFLLDKQTALWDICAQVARKGSLDSSIMSEHPNGIEQLLLDYPNIQLILLTSTKAEQLYRKYFQHLSTNLLSVPSPSPTPGKHVKSFPEKVVLWRAALESVLAISK
jgi:hypoxanthine-DNA glycosylase